MRSGQPLQINKSLAFLEAVLIVALVVIANLFPECVGITYPLENGERVFLPLLSADFSRYLPWLNLLWAAMIALIVLKMRRGYWTRAMLWANIIIAAYMQLLAFAMVLGPSIIGLNPSYAAVQALPESMLLGLEATVIPRLSTVVDAMLTILAFIALIDAYLKLVKVARFNDLAASR
ncbi:MAG: hypothetical protein M9928_14635 [Anaerolineae bacterium]|nr:hypothetical protein [Anaerolineae bacterium]MCO5191755.1 hypothetical protein [Anaerolineae bacterium]MCO5198996.1 hypothetical protein [Anaerolineae bacterium]MCO5206269.1 hypothetical protein [Anaerolineae bacterium]